MWKTSEIPHRWRDCSESWKAHHPNWEHRLWTDEDVDNFVKVHHPGLRGVLDSFPYAIQRVDMMRYLILSVYGGVYVDLDMECLQPLDALLDGLQFAAAYEPREHEAGLRESRVVGNAFLASTREHPLWPAVISELLSSPPKKALPHYDVLTSTGPLFLTRVIRQFGEKRLSLLESHVVYPTVNGSVALKTLTSGGAKGRRMKQRLARDGSFAVHYWANSWVRNLAGELHNPLPYETPGFCFFAGWDSWGQDIRNVGRDIRVLVRECKNDPDALGFNTDGYLKKGLQAPFRWSRMKNAGPNEGLYVKEGELHPALRHIARWLCILRSKPPANARSLVMDRSGIASRMAAAGRPATRSHDAE